MADSHQSGQSALSIGRRENNRSGRRTGKDMSRTRAPPVWLPRCSLQWWIRPANSWLANTRCYIVQLRCIGTKARLHLCSAARPTWNSTTDSNNSGHRIKQHNCVTTRPSVFFTGFFPPGLIEHTWKSCPIRPLYEGPEFAYQARRIAAPWQRHHNLPRRHSAVQEWCWQAPLASAVTG